MNTRHSVANNENRFSLIVATLVASVKPKNEKRQIKAANGSIIVGYARAENGTSGRQHKGSWSIGRFRSGLPEGVCAKALAASVPGDVVDPPSVARAVSRRRRGPELAYSPVPTLTDHCSYCRAVVRRGGRSEEC